MSKIGRLGEDGIHIRPPNFSENRQQLYGMDREMAEKLERKRDPVYEKRAIEWVLNVTGKTGLVNPEIEELKSGVILCELLNKLRPGLIQKISSKKIPLLERENLGFYLQGCVQIGVPSHETFETSDLYEDKSHLSVYNNIYSVARQAASMPGFQGPELKPPNPGGSSLDDFALSSTTHRPQQQQLLDLGLAQSDNETENVFSRPRANSISSTEDLTFLKNKIDANKNNPSAQPSLPSSSSSSASIIRNNNNNNNKTWNQQKATQAKKSTASTSAPPPSAPSTPAPVVSLSNDSSKSVQTPSQTIPSPSSISLSTPADPLKSVLPSGPRTPSTSIPLSQTLQEQNNSKKKKPTTKTVASAERKRRGRGQRFSRQRIVHSLEFVLFEIFLVKLIVFLLMLFS